AEDGIRGRNVTGVQTCALPISNEALAGVPFTFSDVPVTNPVPRTVTTVPAGPEAGVTLPIPSGTESRSTTVSPDLVSKKIWSPRSEERRVGKECRSGLGAAYWY